MFDKLEAVEHRFMEVESRLADPALANQPQEFRHR
jgi:protein subunit release factor A